MHAAATSTYGSTLKIDSTKVSKKLSGTATGSASWATNVGNERDEMNSDDEYITDCRGGLKVDYRDRKKITIYRELRNEKKFGTLHEFACHPCAGAMLIFSVSFQF